MQQRSEVQSNLFNKDPTGPESSIKIGGVCVVADLGEGPRGCRPPPLILGKKKKKWQKEEKPAAGP